LSNAIGTFLSMARAIEMRFFSPPESVEPPSPTIVSYPSGNAMIKSWWIIKGRRAVLQRGAPRRWRLNP
jgi:hypothetical protein